MSSLYRSARGVMVDFELLAIKQQLASAPSTKEADARKKAISERDGVKSTEFDLAMLSLGMDAAAQSAKAVEPEEQEPDKPSTKKEQKKS